MAVRLVTDHTPRPQLLFTRCLGGEALIITWFGIGTLWVATIAGFFFFAASLKTKDGDRQGNRQ
jgi:hypothetical protein